MPYCNAALFVEPVRQDGMSVVFSAQGRIEDEAGESRTCKIDSRRSGMNPLGLPGSTISWIKRFTNSARSKTSCLCTVHRFKVHPVLGLRSTTRRAIGATEYFGCCATVYRQTADHLDAQSFDHSTNVARLARVLGVVLNDAHQTDTGFNVRVVVGVDDSIKLVGINGR